MKRDKINKNSIIVILIIILLFIAFISFVIFNKNDGMKQTLIYNIKYNVYISKNGWQKWSKNGLESGKLNHSISNIKFNIKDSNNFSYDIYLENGKWINDLKANSKINNNKNINGIKVYIYKDLYKKYKICYRTYNKKDKWLGWACNGSISGNKNENIELIEVKIIPKNSSESEYLKDYNISDFYYKEF